MISCPPRVAFFFSTSGHSGVDRIMKNLIPAVARRGYRVDQLKVQGHGPDIDCALPNFRVVDLGTRHTYTALCAVARYLRDSPPAAMLSDKDRVNRTAILARRQAGSATRLVLRSGTTISVDMAHRGAMERWSQRQSMRRLYGDAHAIIVPSVMAARDFVEFSGLPARLIQVVASPVAPRALFEQPAIRPEHPWLAPGAPPVILGVGELSRRKDFATLIRAFAQICASRDARLIILGRGSQRETLLQLASELKIADKVDLPGFSTEVFGYMHHAAAFALCSQWEGMPVVLIEALAAGVAVVATDAPGGSRELLQDGALGPLVPVGDVPALAAALNALLDTPADRQALRAAARPYEIERATDAYLAAMGLPPQAPQ